MLMKNRMALLLALVFTAVATAQTHWVPTWGIGPSPQLADQAEMRNAGLLFDQQTLREIVHTSIGGSAVRVRLSNAYGREAVEIGAAHLALRLKDSAIAPGSDRALTFSGRPAVAIPPNAEVLSDPVKLAAPAASDLAVSIFIPKAVAGAGIHYSSLQTSYIGPGDLTAAASFPATVPLRSWVFLAGIDVEAPESSWAVVAFGDSITDGARSTSDANHRWPDILAARLLERRGGPRIGVLNAGIGGNRILHDGINVRNGVNALARFDRDVLAEPGVKYAIVLEGINDLGHPGSSAPESEAVSAQDIIAGLRQMIERAHEKGLKIFGATLTPFEGAPSRGYFSPEKELQRKAVNEWIRTAKAFDGVIDFDQAVRDPEHPDRMLPLYDSGDHLHPNDAGYKAMGEAIDLNLFR
jgi:lysophospholipase L1-like esterase